MADATSDAVMSSAYSRGVVVVSATRKSAAARIGSAASPSTSHERRLPASWRTVSVKTASSDHPCARYSKTLSRESSSGSTRRRRVPSRCATAGTDRWRSETSRERTRKRPSASISTDSTAPASSRPGGERTCVRRVDADDERPVVELLPDGAEVSARGELPADHEVNAVGQELDLLEDVGGHEDRAALRAQPADDVPQVKALHGVGARQRLVEQQQFRVVDERGGETRALAHAARVPAQLPVLRLREGDGLHGLRRRRRARIGHALEPRAQLDELAPGEEVVHRLVLRHVADPAVEGARSRGWARRTLLTCPWDGAVRPAIVRSSVVLPAPFGPSSAVTPGSTASDTSLTATTPPNHFDTASTAIVGGEDASVIRERATSCVA